MVSALNRKLLRDLAQLKGQVATIAMVLACGIMAMIMLRTTFESLLVSRDEYYREERFADVFASVHRAPDSALARLESIKGVAEVYPRIVKDVMLPLPFEPEPLPGRVISIPDDGRAPLNGLFLVNGRLPERGRPREALLLDQFARARGISPGDRLPAVLNGSLVDLEVVGLVMSPEYVFAIGPGQNVADAARFGVLWMHRTAVAHVFRLEGAFNDVVIRIEPDASMPAVLDAVDRQLERYGTLHSVPRDQQLSNYALTNELANLRGLALMVPMIFLGVAAFLVNIVVSRLVFLERSQIAVLKALGYSNRRIGLHYLGLVALIALIGGVLGVGFGIWSGRWMTGFYREFFNFPSTAYRLTPGVLALALTIGLGSAVTGAMLSVYRVAKLPPAEAMRPPAPASYRRSRLARLGLDRLAGPAATMIGRDVIRKPLRFVLSTAGIAMGVSIYIFGTFQWDSFGHVMLEVFPRQHREDLSVTFTTSLPERSIRELAHLPGVQIAEGSRTVGVRFRSGTIWRDSVIIGLPSKSALRHLFDAQDREISIPDDGLLMTDRLAHILGLEVGDRVQAEILEGDFAKRSVVVSGLIDEPFGLQAYASNRFVDRLLKEEPRVTAAFLRLDREIADEVHARLKRMPTVIGVGSTTAVIAAYNHQTGQSMSVIITILTLSAAAIAIGVVYNNARIALSLRSRELASLRVLGFRRGEISTILLGELATQAALGIPLGLLLGDAWARLYVASLTTETLRFPFRIADKTYAIAALIALVAGAISALFVRRKLDLVEVLKAAE
jgi:putative ABC transport system permease protein